jgi:hypothetical protein
MKPDWSHVYSQARQMRATELVFVKVVMWVFPALALILASGVGLLVDGGLPGVLIFGAAGVVIHVVYRWKAHRLAHGPITAVDAVVVKTDREQVHGSTTQGWRHFISLDVKERFPLTAKGRGSSSGPEDCQRRQTQALVVENVQQGMRAFFVCLGDGDVAGVLDDEGQLRLGNTP